MGILKLAVAGVIGVMAYKAWQRQRLKPAAGGLRDTGLATSPHGDPLVPRDSVTPAPLRVAAQSSRGFGAP